MFDVHYIDWDCFWKWFCRIGIFVLVIMVILFAIYGCAPATKSGQLRSFAIAKTPQDNLESKFQEVIDYCVPRLQEYERKANTQANKAFWMNMSGLLSGAVVAPMIIASGSTGMWPLIFVAGLSGWAGTTPFVGEALRESGLSGSAIMETRNAIVERIRERSTIVLDASLSYEERRTALLGIIGECTIYPMLVPGEK